MLNSSVLRFRQLSSCLIGSKAGLEIRSRRINVHSAMHTSGVTLSIIDFSSGKFLVSRRLIRLVIDNVRSVCIDYWFEKNKRRVIWLDSDLIVRRIIVNLRGGSIIIFAKLDERKCNLFIGNNEG